MDSHTSPLISFILPVYNVGKYLDSTLCSIDNQGLDDSEYEVVLVDDGSTDRSLAICKEWEKSRANYHVLTQKNQKAGYARNTGLRNASGRYVFFMDSDDLLVPHSVRPLMEYLDGRYDMVHASRVRVVDEAFPEIQDNPENHIMFDGSGMDYLKQCTPLLYCTDSFFRRSFLMEKGIQFTNLEPCEDRLFMFEVLSAASLLIDIDRPVYFYMIRSDSISQIRNKKKMSHFVRNQIEIFDRILSSTSTMDPGIHEKWIASIQDHLRWAYERLYSSDMGAAEFGSIVRRLRSKDVLPVPPKGKWQLMMNVSSLLWPCLGLFKAFYSIRSRIKARANN